MQRKTGSLRRVGTLPRSPGSQQRQEGHQGRPFPEVYLQPTDHSPSFQEHKKRSTRWMLRAQDTNKLQGRYTAKLCSLTPAPRVRRASPTQLGFRQQGTLQRPCCSNRGHCCDPAAATGDTAATLLQPKAAEMGGWVQTMHLPAANAAHKRILAFWKT